MDTTCCRQAVSLFVLSSALIHIALTYDSLAQLHKDLANDLFQTFDLVGIPYA